MYCKSQRELQPVCVGGVLLFIIYVRWYFVAIFKCDSCGYERAVPDKLAGKKAKCPKCGHGVAIVDEQALEAESFAAMFTAPDEAESVTNEEETESAQAPDESTMDLDSGDVAVDLSESDDKTCPECGESYREGDTPDGSCPECGELSSGQPDDEGLSEDHVDVSDLVDDSEPQIWESNYGGDGGDEESSLDDTDDGKKSLGLFEGNIALNVFAGLVSGFLCFFFAVAMAMLASSQEELHQYLPYILSTSLTGMSVVCLFYSFQSRIPFALAGPGTATVVILFLFLNALYGDMKNLYGPDVIAVTLIAAIATSSLVAGFAIWCIGKFKIGELIRFIPVQILGGVLGAVGVFAVVMSLDWMGHFGTDWHTMLLSLKDCFFALCSPQGVKTMGPSLVFGLILFLGLFKYKNSLFFLGLLLAASAGSYTLGFLGNEELVRTLASPIPHLEGGVPVLPGEMMKVGFADIEWGIIKNNGLYLGALTMMMILAVMLRITRLELLQGREVDLNVEYRALGVANMISGLCGGMPAAVSYGRSAGSYAVGGRGPIAGIIAALVCAAGLFFIDHLIPLIPKYVPEGLLLFAALSLIKKWMFETRTAFTRRDDMWLLWVVFIVAVVLDLLVGIGFGIAVALIVAVKRNSLGGNVMNILSGASHRSNVDRAPAQQRTLKEFGDHIYIMRLQGFLFLGSLGTLLREIQARLDNRNMLPVEYIILDFRRVTGLASAAGIGFEKLRNLIEEYDIELIITSAPLELEKHLEESGYLGEEENSFRVFFNLDYAMEWCENHVLDSESMLHMKQMALPELLTPVFPEPKYIPALMKVLKRVVVDRGEAVFRQGDESDSMYFVESGRLDVELELEGGKLLRLKKVGPGAVFGEMGIYTMAPRSATIRAAEKCVLFMMTTEKLNAVEKRAPMLVTSIHRFMVNMLSERLGEANFKVRDLMK